MRWEAVLILLLIVSFNSGNENIPPPKAEACTPQPRGGGDSVALKKQQTARKIASLLKNPSALRPKGSHQKSVLKMMPHCREISVKNNIAAAATTNLIQDNQAIKRQKLDDGRSRQVRIPIFLLISISSSLNSISHCITETVYSSSLLDSQSKTNNSTS